jgi:hypothetical protein
MRTDRLSQLARVARHATDMPDGREEKIGLAPLGWK